MQFQHPNEGFEFEIPDSWWYAAGAHTFTPHRAAYRAFSDPSWPTTLVPLVEVAAPRRDQGVVGLYEDRTVSILRAFVQDIELPPLESHLPPQTTKLAVRDGFHRYFASIAVGFSLLPLSVRPYFDINAL
ncbi:MAG TPA: hypothetical protein VK572_01325 [Burkholderiales bacterium]|nr:hypothetical protein [Burkholderiales bacterium]